MTASKKRSLAELESQVQETPPSTVSITKAVVPKYLQQGGFFKSLSEDETDQMLTVPGNVLKPDSSVMNMSELRHLLNSLRFWNVTAIPVEVAAMFLSRRSKSMEAIYAEFEKDFAQLSLWKQIQEAKLDDRLDIAIRSRDFDLVKVCVHSGYDAYHSCKTCAETGQLEMLKYLRNYGAVLRIETCVAAATHGHLDCLEYVLSHTHNSIKCPEMTLAAGANGHLHCLQYLLENRYPMRYDICASMAFAGHVECLKYAHENGHILQHYHAMDKAVEGGHLGCVKYLHEVGCSFSSSTCELAASGGHLDCLQYAVEHGCAWTQRNSEHAAAAGSLPCLQYFAQLGCPFSTIMTYHAAECGSLECLRYLYEGGCILHDSTCAAAAENGHLQCLIYAHEHGAPWNTNVCTLAARHGHLDCLMYAHKQGCAWSVQACDTVGTLACLKYLHEHGCPWRSSTCENAIALGDVSMLQYAHELDCPWNSWTYDCALKYGGKPCLQYLEAHDCPRRELLVMQSDNGYDSKYL